ncbi:hypothetical protein TSOC_005225 [Tetrabaena socialis]|uniref:Rubredoxin-like domain-containing protein n=1 Tax=Tetrabaena socialis TaxID=47790 RepID=A0A2J8A6R7_9CHLO|nr:hypothetical protein TSOC_005225 [Tetrabaena socialis]|eukprot:PNH08214.1 hypothetical protein TSOC_005225 [Tetrabaena socialis]
MAAMQSSFLNRSAFGKSAVRGSVSRQSRVSVVAMAKAKAASKVAYVCLDCGYLYNDPTPFEDLKSYACPVCNAPKRRFKELRGNTLRSNDAKSLAARKAKLIEQIEADGGNTDEGGDELLYTAGAVIVATLGALAYFSQQ